MDETAPATPPQAPEAPVAAAPPPASALARYDRGRMIGAGSAAEVFEGLDPKTFKRVALKVAKGGSSISPEARREAELEARAAAGLKHANLVGLLDAGVDGDKPFIVMERMDGFPLARNTIELETALEVVEKAARGVDAVNKLGIIHGDLKPGQILMTRAGEPKVADVGLHHWRPAADITACAAPEQLNGGKITARTDVYALGAILYEYVTGKPAFEASTPDELKAKILSSAPTPPKQLEPTVNADLDTVILKALEKDPEFRFAGAGDLADELARLRRHMPIRTRRLSAMNRVQRRVVRHKTATLGVLLLIAGAAAGAFFFNEHLKREAALKAESDFKAGLETSAAAIREASGLVHQAGTDPAQVRALAAKAAGLLASAIAYRPDVAAMHLDLGRAREIEGRDDLAEAAFRKAMELDAKSVRVKFALAKLLARRSFLEYQLAFNARMGGFGDPGRVETRKLLDQVLETPAELESDLDRDVAAVQLTLAKGDKDATRAAALAKIGDYRGRPGEDDFQFLLAQVTDGQLKLESLNRVIELRPLDAVALYYRGTVQTGLKQWDAAIADFRAALKVIPGMDAAAVGVAVALEAKGDREGAIAELKSCLDLHPDFVLGLGVRGRLLSEVKKLPESLADFDRALKLKPEFRLALAYRGVVHNLSQQYERALADLNRALEGSKNDQKSDQAFMRLHRGTVLAQLKRFDEAVRDLDEAARLDEANPEPHARKSYALGSKAEPEFRKALAEIDEAIRIAPADWPSKAWAAEWRAHVVRSIEAQR